MDPINRIPGSLQHPRSLTQQPKHVSPSTAQCAAASTKPNTDEVYLSSCRPTRLSMELMSKAREQGGK